MEINVYSMLLNEARIPYLSHTQSVKTSDKKCNYPEKIVDILNTAFHVSSLPEEHVWLVCINNACDATGIFEISHGTSKESVFSLAGVYSRVLLSGASGYILVHNHPSGYASPSEVDKEVAKRFMEAGKIMDIHMCDFLIVGDLSDPNFFSFLEHGLL